MKLTKRHLILVLFPLLIAIIIYAGLAASIPKAGPLMKPVTTVREDPNKKEKLHYIAIGDSLTEGVGDQTKQGGFVPLVANDLKDRYNLTAVETENYGVNGERSDQILTNVFPSRSWTSNENISSSGIPISTSWKVQPFSFAI
ncbi:hypothetical protein EfmAA55_11450 [Enterococcus faecium]|nr:hypothetical protein EfmAA55_11450 [Enterococcus faecium]